MTKSLRAPDQTRRGALSYSNQTSFVERGGAARGWCCSAGTC